MRACGHYSVGWAASDEPRSLHQSQAAAGSMESEIPLCTGLGANRSAHRASSPQAPSPHYPCLTSTLPFHSVPEKLPARSPIPLSCESPPTLSAPPTQCDGSFSCLPSPSACEDRALCFQKAGVRQEWSDRQGSHSASPPQAPALLCQVRPVRLKIRSPC